MICSVPLQYTHHRSADVHLYLCSHIYYTAVYHKIAETDTPRRQSVCTFALTRSKRLRTVSVLSRQEADAEGRV